VDGQRFDILARAVAGNGSRRGLLRGLVGAVGLLALGRRAPDVAAQGGYLGPGEACYDSSQCGNTRYNEMFCDDNGLGYDGSLNCCAYEGGYCYGDDGCCGSATCITGSCTTASSYPSPGDPCQVNDDCFALGLVCDYVGLTGDSRCCGYEGSACGWDGQCCGWLTCGADGYCTSGSQDSSGIVTCSGVGCTCIGGAPGACDNDMMCCVQGDPGAIGFCLPVDACYVSMGACSDVDCSCAVHDPYACGSNLICCGTGEAGAIGTCQAIGDC
jgi:hypothetical protein